jgi:hypothetical protein
MSKVFYRPLFNAGRWSHQFSSFPSDARLETDGSRAREILPEGYKPFVKPPKPPKPVIETVSQITAKNNRDLNVNSHGGSCCGRNHLSNFGNSGPTLSKLQTLKAKITPRRCVEICLTSAQARQVGWKNYTWDKALKELGWKEVMVFNNGNSGNDVHVYLYSTTER